VDSLKNKLDKTKLNHAVYYRFITGDSVTDSKKDYELMKSYLEHSKMIENFNWKGLESYNAKHMAFPRLGVMAALLEIFNYWSDEMNKVLSEENIIFNRTEKEHFSQKMATHYGPKIGLGIGNINGIAYKYNNDKKYSEARLAWEIMLEEYPIFADSLIRIVDTYAKENNKPEAIKYYKKSKQ
jgi:tetratricopeptide (TPR) repeat protein